MFFFFFRKRKRTKKETPGCAFFYEPGTAWSWSVLPKKSMPVLTVTEGLSMQLNNS